MLKPPTRVLSDLISKLMIQCSFADRGCRFVTRLDNLEAHADVCEHNPRFDKAKDEPKLKAFVVTKESRETHPKRLAKSNNEVVVKSISIERSLDSYVKEVKVLEKRLIKMLMKNDTIKEVPEPTKEVKPKENSAVQHKLTTKDFGCRVQSPSNEHRDMVSVLISNGVIKSKEVEQLVMAIDFAAFYPSLNFE